MHDIRYPFSQELKLLVALSKCHISPSDKAEISTQVDNGFERKTLGQLVTFHRLGVHISRNINTLPSELLPAKLKLNLVRHAAYAEGFTKQQIAQWVRVNRAFMLADIGCMLIKGPATANRLYRDPYRRIIYDIDIMTRPEHTGRAIEILESLGFAQTKPIFEQGLRAVDIRRLQKWGSNIGFSHFDAPDVLIELHWRPGRYQYEFDISTQELWGRAVSCNIAGEQALCLDPVHEALFLCSHGCKHEWKRLHWLLDISAILHQKDFDWGLAIEIAKTRHMHKVVVLSTYLAHKVFAAPLPAQIEAAISQDAKLRSRADFIMQCRIHNAPKNDSVLEEVMMEFRNLDLQARPLGRLRIVLAQLVPGPDDWNWVRLPRWAMGAYYGVRPIRIIVETLRSILQTQKQNSRSVNQGKK